MLRIGDSRAELFVWVFFEGEPELFIAAEAALKASKPVLDRFELYSLMMLSEGCLWTGTALNLLTREGD